MAGFFWAIQLGAGDMHAYLIICLLSGAALGRIRPAGCDCRHNSAADRGRAASYFGIWSLINKGAGIGGGARSWPARLSAGGDTGLVALAVVCAGIPCLIKLLSALLLLRWRFVGGET